MSETKHTPGPWVFPEGSFSYITEGARPHMRIAFLPSDWREYASSEANAYLLRAAPDMYEALEATDTDLTLLLASIAAGDPAAELRVRVEDIRRRQAAAIAKAKGESNV